MSHLNGVVVPLLSSHFTQTNSQYVFKEVTLPEVNLDMNQNGLPTSPTITDTNHLTPYKVHLRGLDNLRTNDIRAFASEHFSEADPLRIEWIDDTSANLVYDSATTAEKALMSFSAIEGAQIGPSSMLQLRPTKSLRAHPEVRLEARLAVITDRKQPGARDRSRFYLFNPEEDPGERRDRRRRGGGRGYYTNGGDHGDYRRRRYDDEEQRRRKGGDDGFDASLYDDDVGMGTRDSSSGRSGNRSHGEQYVRFRQEGGQNGRELFPERADQRTRRRRGDRDRSASPGREGASDGRMEIDNEENVSAKRRRRFRQRSPSPGRGSRMVEEGNPPSNKGKELFPEKKSINDTKNISTELRSTLTQTTTTTTAATTTNSKVKDLFPHKIQGHQSHHKRSPAFDATRTSLTSNNTTFLTSSVEADDPANLFVGKMTVPFTDGTTDVAAPTTRRKSNKSTTGFSILGAASRLAVDQQQQQDNNQGFSIRGAAAAAAADMGVVLGAGRELFPHQQMISSSGGGAAGLNNNVGKELFADRLESSGRLGRLGGGGRGRRRKAEDMFY